MMPLPYLDPARPVDERVDDLLARMTLEDKAGQLFQTMISTQGGADHRVDLPSSEEYIQKRRMTHFNALASPRTAREFAQWHNDLQALAADTGLGIPVTISSDPRHAFTENPGAALAAGPFSQWPEPLGLAALRDERVMEEFADTVRREYLAVGIRVALHPQVDLMTEPRWARAVQTFGEDAGLSARLAAAYIRGLQGTGDVARERGESGEFGPRSVSAMVKHFPGGGPQLDGEDPHFAYGREQVYPGGAYEDHLAPFLLAVAAGVRQVMPYYGMPVGLTIDGEPVEPVGFGFNRQILTGQLRERLGFDGIVCTDWGLVTDSEVGGVPFPARAWGVEHLDRAGRVEMILHAGADQLGGEACPEIVVELVESGRVPETRVDRSVRRLLREKFLLGLFDEARYVDADAADSIVGSAPHRRAGWRTQAQSVTVLTQSDEVPLPLAPGTRVYLESAMSGVTDASGLTLVSRSEEADVVIARLSAPYEERGPGFDGFFHAGSLDFPQGIHDQVRTLAEHSRVLLAFDLDRPAILTPLIENAEAMVVTYGASDTALLAALAGRVDAVGKLPFDLPRSMDAVVASRSDVAFDTVDPVFRFGHGLSSDRDG